MTYSNSPGGKDFEESPGPEQASVERKEPRWTPGPLTIDDRGLTYAVLAEIDGAGCTLAHTANEPFLGINVALANATLYAAAPDLYEACKAALATHSLTDSEPGLPSLTEVGNMLKAALLKANPEGAGG